MTLNQVRTTIPSPHVYVLIPRYRRLYRGLGTFLLVAGCLFALGVGSVVATDPYAFLSAWPLSFFVLCFSVCSLLCVLFGIMHWMNAESMHLTTSSDGLVVHTYGYTLTTSWSNIGRIGVRRGEEQLFLSQPATMEGWAAHWMRLYQIDRFIWLEPFGAWWGDSSLAQELRTYIPQVVGAHQPL